MTLYLQERSLQSKYAQTRRNSYFQRSAWSSRSPSTPLISRPVHRLKFSCRWPTTLRNFSRTQMRWQLWISPRSRMEMWRGWYNSSRTCQTSHQQVVIERCSSETLPNWSTSLQSRALSKRSWMRFLWCKSMSWREAFTVWSESLCSRIRMKKLYKWWTRDFRFWSTLPASRQTLQSISETRVTSLRLCS